MIPIENVKNIGPKSALWLHDAGIHTDRDLFKVGAAEAWLHTKALYPQVSLVLLYALQGAILDIHWNAVPEDMKADLRQQIGRKS